MLVLRILTLPITIFVFMAVTVAATKAPAAVEMMSIGLWFALPLFLAIAAVKRLAGR